MVGTPEFMSPEQLFDAKTVDHRADLWSLACVAYCCLTGTLPFEAETLPQLCKELLAGDYFPPSTVREDLPVEIDAWFEKALHPKLTQRFDDAKEMAVAFVRAIAVAHPTEETGALERYLMVPSGIFRVSSDKLAAPRGAEAPAPPSTKALEIDIDRLDASHRRSRAPWLLVALIALGGGGYMAYDELMPDTRVGATAPPSSAPSLVAPATASPSATPHVDAEAPSAEALAPRPSPVAPLRPPAPIAGPSSGAASSAPVPAAPRPRSRPTKKRQEAGF
jgi:serine/threonine-protein kinase